MGGQQKKNEFKINYWDEPELGSSGSRKNKVAGCCGQGNEPCYSTKCRDIFN
jgi:hypothetical protein